MATIDINQLIQESLSDYSSNEEKGIEETKFDDLEEKLKGVVLEGKVKDTIDAVKDAAGDVKEKVVKGAEKAKDVVQDVADSNPKVAAGAAIGTGLLGAGLAAKKMLKKKKK